MGMLSARVTSVVAGLALAASFLGTAKLQAQPEPLRSQRSISPGVEYFHERQTNVPWSIHVVRVERDQPNLALVPTLACGKIFGLATVSEQVKALEPKAGAPLAAINGDFFVITNTPYQGDPRGLQIFNGELISTPTNNGCFWVDAGGQPHATMISSRLSVTWPDGTSTPIGLNEESKPGQAVLYTFALGESTRTAEGPELVLARAGGRWLPLELGRTYHARVREVRTNGNTPLALDRPVLALSASLAPDLAFLRKGSRLKISTRTEPDISQAQFAVGGGPILLVQGKPISWPSPLTPRQPRSAIGWNEKYLFLVAVDGRQKDLSVGMTFQELAELMARLGCIEAMNFDGGGSTTLWIDGRVLNSPSDGHERPVANALVLIQKLGATLLIVPTLRKRITLPPKWDRAR